ncbi:MAG TPA: hypothetical protein VJW73_03595 [Gemmatimonadaceae bacterium]|nr:hypothetical protein [Gemmatimonadaceae bacterium]
MRIHLCCVVAASIVTCEASAQLPSQPSAVRAVGTWRGTSVCLVRPSPCHDETVVYRITQMKAADSVSIDARKIVRGQEEEMGVLACRFVSRGNELLCVLPLGLWHFAVRNDSLTGELRLNDSTRFRDVRAMRAPNE